MPGRKYAAASGYRYGFNGQEKDQELNENITTAQYWEYDARIGRRWNIDPDNKPFESTYSTFANNAIYYIDPLGLDWYKNQTNGQASWMDGNAKHSGFSYLGDAKWGDKHLYFRGENLKEFVVISIRHRKNLGNDEINDKRNNLPNATIKSLFEDFWTIKDRNKVLNDQEFDQFKNYIIAKGKSSLSNTVKDVRTNSGLSVDVVVKQLKVDLESNGNSNVVINLYYQKNLLMGLTGFIYFSPKETWGRGATSQGGHSFGGYDQGEALGYIHRMENSGKLNWKRIMYGDYLKSWDSEVAPDRLFDVDHWKGNAQGPVKSYLRRIADGYSQYGYTQNKE